MSRKCFILHRNLDQHEWEWLQEMTVSDVEAIGWSSKLGNFLRSQDDVNLAALAGKTIEEISQVDGAGPTILREWQEFLGDQLGIKPPYPDLDSFAYTEAEDEAGDVAHDGGTENGTFQTHWFCNPTLGFCLPERFKIEARSLAIFRLGIQDEVMQLFTKLGIANGEQLSNLILRDGVAAVNGFEEPVDRGLRSGLREAAELVFNELAGENFGNWMMLCTQVAKLDLRESLRILGVMDFPGEAKKSHSNFEFHIDLRNLEALIAVRENDMIDPKILKSYLVSDDGRKTPIEAIEDIEDPPYI